MSTEINAQSENCDLSCIGGKMRTIAWEIAFQIAPRIYSQEVERKVSTCDFGEAGVHAIKHMFLQMLSACLVKVTVSHQEQTSPRRILVLF